MFMLTQRVRDVQKLHDTIDDLRQEMADANSTTAKTSRSVTVYREYPTEHGDGRGAPSTQHGDGRARTPAPPLQSLEEQRHSVNVREDRRMSQSRYRDGQ